MNIWQQMWFTMSFRIGEKLAFIKKLLQVLEFVELLSGNALQTVMGLENKEWWMDGEINGWSMDGVIINIIYFHT